MIPYGHQWVDDDDIAAVVDVLKGDWLTGGPAVEEFESSLVAATGARHAVAFSSGTAALHAACAAAGIGPGHLVGTSTLSFVGSANCARYLGAGVRLLDIDPETLNVDPQSVPSGLDALVAVHYAGLPMDLHDLDARPAIVIEDAAHSIGASTPDGPVGSCAHSDLCCFSFHPVKTVTTGEGGAVTTNSDELAAHLRRFRNHGLVRRPERGGWYQETVEEGFNYRLTDLQAALGRSQMRKLDRFVTRRNGFAARYRTLLAPLPVVLPPAAPEGTTHAYHLFAIRVADRARVYDVMRSADVGVQVHYVPIHQHPRFAGHHALPRAEAAYDGLLSLPLFPALTEAEQDRVVEVLSTAVGSAS